MDQIDYIFCGILKTMEAPVLDQEVESVRSRILNELEEFKKTNESKWIEDYHKELQYRQDREIHTPFISVEDYIEQRKWDLYFNNWFTKLPNIHHSDRGQERSNSKLLGDWDKTLNDILIEENSTESGNSPLLRFSDKRLHMTDSEFYSQIDSAIEKSNVNLEQLAMLLDERDMDGKNRNIRIQINKLALLPYTQLIADNFNKDDLTV
jgi:hypothetical protein